MCVGWICAGVRVVGVSEIGVSACIVSVYAGVRDSVKRVLTVLSGGLTVLSVGAWGAMRGSQV